MNDNQSTFLTCSQIWRCPLVNANQPNRISQIWKRKEKKLVENVANYFGEIWWFSGPSPEKLGICDRIFPFSVLIFPTLCESSHPRKNADKLLVILGERVPKVPRTPGVPQGPPSLRRPPVCNKAATAPRRLGRIQSFCVLSQSERSPARR